MKFRETEIGKIPFEWDIKTIDGIKAEEKKAIISGPFGSNISSKYFVQKGIPVIRGNNLSLDIGKKFNDNGFVYLTEEKAKELGTWAEQDDLIFTAAGTIGQVGLLSGKEQYSQYIISNKQLRVRVNKKIVDPLFAYYWFACPSMVDTITRRDTGSTIPLINLSVLKGLLIPVPPLPEQKMIASLLGSLDDKIELLSRQNKTLEALAETLFRQWFVEEAEENWERGKLGNYGEFKNGINYSRDESGDTTYGIINVRDVMDNKFIFKEAVDEISIDFKKAEPYLLQKFDTVIVRSASPGETALILENQKKLIYSGFTIRFRPHEERRAFFFFQLMQSIKKQLDSFSDGTTLKNLNQEILKNIEFPVPPTDKFESFNNKIEPMFDKISKNITQVRTLTRLRDTLLPKLMRGELRIR